LLLHHNLQLVPLILLLAIFLSNSLSIPPYQLISMSFFSFQQLEPEYGSSEGVQGDWEPLTEGLDAPSAAPPTPRGTGRKRGRPKGSGRGRASSKGSSPSPSPNPVISFLTSRVWHFYVELLQGSLWPHMKKQTAKDSVVFIRVVCSMQVFCFVRKGGMSDTRGLFVFCTGDFVPIWAERYYGS
jgi:hypothetical protein